LFLNQQDVIKARGLDIKEAIQAVEEGFALHGLGEYTQPPKINLRKGPPGSIQAEQGLIMAMPSYLGGDIDIIGLKWVLAMAENPQKYGLPRSSALVILNDPETGLPLAIMDGALINVVRTGAVSGVGARYLARSESELLGLVGAGPQGRMQILALAAVLTKLKEVRIFDLNRTRAALLAEEMEQELFLKASAVDSAKNAVRGCDLIVTATITRTPYLEGDWLSPGVFYADIAANDAKLTAYKRADKIFVDDWKQMKHHGAGELVKAVSQGAVSEEIVTGELGEVVVRKKAGRQNAGERIVFKHIGMSVTDLPVAKRIYKRAKEKGLGTSLVLWES
jgi:ornithine cyclodeaminase